MNSHFLAASHQSVEAAGISASSTSTPTLIAGLAFLGGGGWLIYDGMKDRREAGRPRSQVSFVASPKAAGFVFRRTW